MPEFDVSIEVLGKRFSGTPKMPEGYTHGELISRVRGVSRAYAAKILEETGGRHRVMYDATSGDVPIIRGIYIMNRDPGRFAKLTDGKPVSDYRRGVVE